MDITGHPDVPDANDLIAAIAGDDRASLDLPHVIAVYDPYLDTTNIIGPFPNPLAATVFADKLTADLTYDGCERPITTTIHPLHRS